MFNYIELGGFKMITLLFSKNGNFITIENSEIIYNE